MAQRQTFKPLADRPRMIPAIAIVPMYPGASVLNVFQTGGSPNARDWIRGSLAGFRSFYAAEEADAVAETAGGYIVRRADHFVFIPRGGLFDPDAQAAA